jgi:hypothetical protein
VAESLREFLDRRERELLIELAPAENQVLAIKAELAEIHHAKASLEATAIQLEVHKGSFGFGSIGELKPSFGLGGIVDLGLADGPLPVRQERLSIKQMILMVLEQDVKFRRYGATASEIRESIKNGFGREIEGTSLSPQLSRLRDDGYVDVHENRWKLTNPRAKTANNPNFVGRQMSSALHDHMNEAPPGDDPDSAPESPDVGK